MNATELKSVAFGGYDKKEVLDYIDVLNGKILKLESEIANALSDASSARRETADAQREMEALRRSLEERPDEDARFQALWKEIDTAKQAVEQHRASADNLTAELIRVKSANTELERENASMKLKLEEDRRRFEGEREQSRRVEAGAIDIGNIMIDARRAADEMLQGARDRAQDILVEAAEQRAAISANLEEMAGRLREIGESLDSFYQDGSAELARTAQLVSAACDTVRADAGEEPAPEEPVDDDDDVETEVNVFL